MKAKLVEAMPSGGDWIYEIKFDGYRALALRGGSETRVLSRNQKELGGKFPEVKDSIATLDRSIFRTPSLTVKMLRWMKKAGRRFSYSKASTRDRNGPPIVFYAFDLLQLNGKDLQGLTIEKRKAKLEALLNSRRVFSDIRPHSQKTYQSFWKKLGRSDSKA
jgi:bifunctional non-homologous end joining protein LigD